MKAVFLCALNNISSGDLKNPINLRLGNAELPIIKITNKTSDIKPFLTQSLKEAIGKIEYEYLSAQAPFIAYCESEFNEQDISPLEYLNLHLYILSTYLFCLWCVKDNAVDFELGFLKYTVNDETKCSSNLLSITNYTCLGESTQSIFSSQELNKAAIFLENNIEMQTEKNQSANIGKYGRITIANYYIQHARSCSDLGLKIASYCSALECLFSNDNTELSHKLSERIALFLYTQPDDRIRTFKLIKQAYSFRSKVVHGDKLKEDKLKELTEVIKGIDNICREIMNYAFKKKDNNIFEYTKDRHEEYFLNLLMAKEVKI